MSKLKLTRALTLAATVAAMNLAGLTAIAHAQANDQDTPSQQELAERWNTDYYQATHMSPAQHKAWLQANAAHRSDSSRWAALACSQALCWAGDMWVAW